MYCDLVVLLEKVVTGKEEGRKFSCRVAVLSAVMSVSGVYLSISQEYTSNKRIMRDISYAACKQAKELFK